MNSIKITSANVFESILEQFKKTDKIVFRGQTSDRPLIPSMLRGNYSKSPRLPGCIPQLTVNWNLTAKRIVSSYGIRSNFFKTEAIMQHYGYRSTFIDVSQSPEIALWFALNKFSKENTPLFIGNDLRSAVFQRSYYTPTKKGFFYVIKCPNSADHKYINLTKIMPESAKRVHRQKASAIFCFPKAVSADSLIMQKYEVIDNGWFRDSNYNPNAAELFPPPSVDLFYRQLCIIPYYITPYREKNKLKIGHPLLGMFPIYARSIKELVLEYAPLTKIVQTSPSIKWSIAKEVISCEDKRFKVRAATKIIISRLITEDVAKALSWRSIRKDNLPSNNLIFEFEPEASIVNPSLKNLDEVVLGLWVVFDEKSLHVSLIIDNFKELVLGHQCVYSLPELSLVQKSCNCSDHNKDLAIITYLLRCLSKGSLHLRKVDKWYWEARP